MDERFPTAAYMTLVFICGTGPLSRQEIRRLLSDWFQSPHRTTVSRALRHLRDIGVVDTAPHPDDGRQTLYGLSDNVYIHR